ncbi:MAG: ATP-binding cassette domain-containing protein [Sandaracinaceae bacterium]
MSDVMIEARGLGKRYGEVVALRDASFELRRGEILGFIGPNGAGKSTTMKILTCVIAPTSGTATVNGYDIWDDSLGVRRSVGYLPESNPLYDDMLVIEYLQWVAAMRTLPSAVANQRVDTVIGETGLGDVLGRPIGELSKGFRQRVGLSQALIHEPPILILDEPFSGLDPNQASEIRSLVTGIGKSRSIILSTHNLAEVKRTCRRVMIVDRGRIVADERLAEIGRENGGRRYRIEVLAPEGQAPETSALAGVAGVRAVTVGDAHGGGRRTIEVEADAPEDLRPALVAAAAGAGLGLLSIAEADIDLEGHFRELTTRDAEVFGTSDPDDLDDALDQDEEE